MMTQVSHVYGQLDYATPERKCQFCMDSVMQEPMSSTSKINHSISFPIEFSFQFLHVSASYHIQNLLH